ncbi:hypothetical protein KKB55_18445 [Myxococcota bacterium]|nr:hypothetical protein [Myxococcota bacterium]
MRTTRLAAWITLIALSACDPEPRRSTAFTLDAQAFTPLQDASVTGDGGRRPAFRFPFLEGEDEALLRLGLIKLSACGLPITFDQVLGELFFVERLRERQIRVEATRMSAPGRSVTSLYPLLDAAAELRCVVEAARCDVALGCLGLVPDVPCEPTTFEDYCGEGKAVLCAQLLDLSAPVMEARRSITMVRDCARQAEGNHTCHVNLDADFRRVECVYATTCEGDFPRCDGEAVLTCEAGRVFRRRCDRFGAVCVEGACVYGPDHHCAQYDGALRRCAGGLVEACGVLEIMESESGRDRGAFSGGLDCGAEGLACEGIDDCALDPPECTLLGSAACDHDVATLCVKGRAYAVDCGQIGAKCEENGGRLRCRLDDF